MASNDELLERHNFMRRWPEAIKEAMDLARRDEREQCCKDVCKFCRDGLFPLKDGENCHKTQVGWFGCAASAIRERAAKQAGK